MIIYKFYNRDIWMYIIEMLFYLFLGWKVFVNPNSPLIISLAEEAGENTYMTKDTIRQILGTLSVAYVILSFWGAIVCIVQIRWMEIAINILNVVTILFAITATLICGRKKK